MIITRELGRCHHHHLICCSQFRLFKITRLQCGHVKNLANTKHHSQNVDPLPWMASCSHSFVSSNRDINVHVENIWQILSTILNCRFTTLDGKYSEYGGSYSQHRLTRGRLAFDPDTSTSTYNKHIDKCFYLPFILLPRKFELFLIVC